MGDAVLVGDIGGTNSRFAMVRRGQTAVSDWRHYDNASHASLQDAIETYRKETGERPDAGVVAIAGPVSGDVVGPTNLVRWRFRPPALAQALGFDRLDVINDFEAVAYALPHLGAGETTVIGAAAPDLVPEAPVTANMAVLGPGTGLGVGALVRVAGRMGAVPSEGGHAEIGAPVGRWAEAHEIIRREVGRVSGEHVLSGPGLERIDAALRRIAGHPERLAAAEIGARAVAGTDPVAAEAARLFFDYLARFAGDVGLMFAAKGGVFLYGGVVQKLAPVLDATRFRTAFEAKSPLEPFLETIPTRLITNLSPGLIGCAAVAAGW